MAETRKNVSDSLKGKYLTLVLEKERYGVEILKVQEIIRVVEITRIPRCPDYVKGVLNLRGRIIPVIELRLKLGMESIRYDDQACIVVLNLRQGERTIAVGMIVDSVVEVIEFLPDEIESPPDGIKAGDGYILGIGRRANGPLCLLLDIDRLLDVKAVGSLNQSRVSSELQV